MKPDEDLVNKIERPRPGIRPVVVLLYPHHDYCCVEDPIYDTRTECRFKHLTLLNEALINHQVMFTEVTGIVGVTGKPGEPGTVYVRKQKLSETPDEN